MPQQPPLGLYQYGTYQYTNEAAQIAQLPNQPPSAEERQYLRRLYEETGSKNKVLRLVWSGVVNADGKTPKTKRWLDEAIAEVITT